jgi:hypothetical protein
VNIGLGGGNVTSNLGIGRGALTGNSGGLFNTAIGSGAMEIGTNSYSIAFGYSALNSCTGGGINNVALGSSTMTTISSASNNVAIGSNSLPNLIDGNYNISIGGESQVGNGNGSSNLAIGYQALYTSNASNNIGIGYQALYTNDEGQQNTAIGNEALKSITTTGSAERNTAIGYQAGRWKGTGTSVIANRLNTANDSIFIGWRARSSADAQTNQIVIGNNTVGGGSNTITIGTTASTSATIYGGLNLPSGLSASGATFTGLVSSTVGFSGSATNLVGNANGLTAGTASRVQIAEGAGSSYYLALVGGTGNTGIFVDTSVPRWVYNASTGSLVTTTGYIEAATLRATTAIYSNTFTSNDDTAPLYIVSPYYDGTNQLISIGDTNSVGYSTKLTIDDTLNTIKLEAQTISVIGNATLGSTASNTTTIYGAKIVNEGVYANGSLRTANISFANGQVQTLTGVGTGATGMTAIYFTGAPPTGAASITAIITNGGLMTGAGMTSWGGNIKWPGGTKPLLTSSGVDVVSFVTPDAGTTIYGFVGGLGFS